MACYSSSQRAPRSCRCCGVGPVILPNFRRLQFVSCAVANVEHVNPLPFLNNTKYDTIDVRLVAVEEMAELRFLRRHGAAVWQFFQAGNNLLEPSVPLQGCIRLLGIDLPVQACEIALC
jgi:hypothetical protein